MERKRATEHVWVPVGQHYPILETSRDFFDLYVDKQELQIDRGVDGKVGQINRYDSICHPVKRRNPGPIEITKLLKASGVVIVLYTKTSL